MRVLAAMSGGVDSAVAAARAADAGHDVTGVHLALSRNPQTYRAGARGCCTLEDARDARRAADVIGIPFYVWDMAEQFHEDVVDDFVAEYAAGRTPNPCLRCNEKIKFAAVLDRASRSASTRWSPVTTPGSAPTACCAAASTWPRTSPTCWPCSRRDQLDRSMFPLGDSTKAQVRDEAAARGLAVADQARLARHLLHRRWRHAGLPGRAPGLDGRRHRRRGHRCGARSRTTAPITTPSGSARAWD